MKIVLDTHVLIWYAANDPQLSAPIRDQINDTRNEVLVSSISCWEIAIKFGLGKLELSIPIHDLLDLKAHGVAQIDLSLEDVQTYSNLGFPLPHHRDPFDRMIAIQTMGRGATLMTADPVFTAYLPSQQIILA